MARSSRMTHLEEYLDTIEAVPAELSRSFSKIYEIDINAKGSVDRARQMVSKFLADFRIMSNEERANALKSLNDVLQEMLVYGKEKVDIAVQAYCSVEEHIRSLDESLSRFEEEEFIGPSISRKSSISDRQKQQKVTPADGHASSAPSYEQKDTDASQQHKSHSSSSQRSKADL